MSPSHVREVAAAMRSSLAPRGSKALARAFGAELTRQIAAQVSGRQRPTRADDRRLEALLGEALSFTRDAVAREARRVRRRAGMTRLEVARRLGCTPSRVARAERGEAAFDEAFVWGVRAIGRTS